MTLRPALFLDRDGVINQDLGHVVAQQKVTFVEGIFDLCRKAKALEYLVVVVTNQAAIGRGLATEEDFKELMAWMCEVFQKTGAQIDAVYYSPYHPEYGLGKYKADSPLRKPSPGMILKARDELGIDLPSSVLIGDKETDILAGLAAGVGCNLLYTYRPELLLSPTQATATIVTLGDALPYLGKALSGGDTG